MNSKLLLSVILPICLSFSSFAQDIDDLYRIRGELQSNIDDLTSQLARINLKIKEVELQQSRQSESTSYRSATPERNATASISSERRSFDDRYSCNTLTKSEKDKFTGNVLTSLAETVVVSSDGQNGFGINLFRRDDNELIFLTIKTVGAGNCVNERDRVYINFADGSKMDLWHMGKFDCDATATVYFGRGYSNYKKLKMLAQKRIAAMRVWIGDSYVDEELTEENSLALMNAIKCFAE